MFFQQKSRRKQATKQAKKLLKEASKSVVAERLRKLQDEVELGIKENVKKADLPDRYRKALDDLESGIMEKAGKADLAGRSRKVIEELEKAIIEGAEKADFAGRSKKAFADLERGILDRVDKADLGGQAKKVLEELEKNIAETAEKADIPGHSRKVLENIEQRLGDVPGAAQRFTKDLNLDPDRIELLKRLRGSQKRKGLARVADVPKEHTALTVAFVTFLFGSLAFFIFRMLRSGDKDVTVNSVANESLKVAHEAAETAQKLAKSVEESITSSKVTLEKLVNSEKSAARPHVSVHAFPDSSDSDFVTVRLSIRNTGPGSATDVQVSASVDGVECEGTGAGIDDRIPALSPRSNADDSDGLSIIKVPVKDGTGKDASFPRDVEIQIDYSDVADGSYWTKQTISVEPEKAPRHVGKPKFGEA